jgi:uncharacterized membrane protein
MKRSVQEIVELLVFGLIALLIGTGLLWLAGWVFDLLGVLLKFFAGLIWSLLRFIVPVAVVAAIVYALVRLFQQQRERGNEKSERTAAATATTESDPAGSDAAGSEIAASEVAVSPQAEAGPHTAGGADEAGRKHLSEVWAPPQPSPPAKESSPGERFEEEPEGDWPSAGLPIEHNADEAAGAVPGTDALVADDEAVAAEGDADLEQPKEEEEDTDGDRRS